MQYKTIILHLLEQHPQMRDQLKRDRQMLPAMGGSSTSRGRSMGTMMPLRLSLFQIPSGLGMTEEVFGLIDQASFAHVFDEAAPAPSGALGDPGEIFRPDKSIAMIRDIRFVGGKAHQVGLGADDGE